MTFIIEKVEVYRTTDYFLHFSLIMSEFILKWEKKTILLAVKEELSMRINEKIASVCFIFASVFMIAGRTAFASESVARIGGKEYDDIDVALSDAGNGETIVLLDDVKTYELGAETVGESLILDRDLSFDLNGFTLEHAGTTVEID